MNSRHRHIHVYLIVFCWNCFSVPILAQAVFGPTNTILGAYNESFYSYTPVDWVDFDMDGDTDMLMAANSGFGVAWAENINGEGQFSTFLHVINSEGMDSYESIAADMDEDGDMDVLIIQNDISFATIAWIENLDGLGNFSETAQAILSESHINRIAAKDVDLDGDTDLFVARNNTIYWAKNLGGINNFAPIESITGSFGSFPKDPSLIPIDMDKDNDFDLVSVSNDKEKLFFNRLEYTDSFYYEEFQLIDDLATLGEYLSIVIEDFDGDTDLDILAGVNYPSVDSVLVYWYEQDDLGAFKEAELLIGFEDGDTYGMNLSDMNDDGQSDILLLAFPDPLWSERIVGSSSFSSLMIFDSIYTIGSVIDVDIDDDGDLDLFGRLNANPSSTEDKHIIYNQQEDNSYKKNIFDGAIYGINSSQSRFPVFDIDNDEDLDFVLAMQYKLVWYENVNGKFSENIISYDYFSNRSPIEIDIDLDGDSDLLSITDNTVLLFENIDGQGCFEPPIELFSQTGIGELTSADMDGDNDLDLVYNRNDRIYWRENDGQGSFDVEHTVSGFSDDAKQPFLADLDGDGDMDIISKRGFSSDRIIWYENEDGLGNFSTFYVVSDASSSEFQIHDMNKDGQLDIVARAPTGSSLGLVWFENTDGQGDFETQNIIWETEEQFFSEGYMISDFDGDDDMDVILTSLISNGNDTIIFSFIENVDGQGTFELNNKFSRDIGRLYRGQNHDFDEDGDDDISMITNNGVYWLQNISTETALAGKCFLDANENAIQDNGEIGLLDQVIQVAPSAINSYSEEDGSFKFAVGAGNYNIRIFPKENWTVTTEESYSVDVLNMVIPNINFGLIPTVEVKEVSPVLTSAPTRCGFEVPFWSKWTNKGTVFADGRMHLELDPLTSMISASPEPDSISGNTLIWDITNLGPTQHQRANLLLQMPGVEYLGDTLSFRNTSFIKNEQGELIENESYTYQSVVNCAYDPNDKQVVPAGVEEEGYTLFGESLEYTIRFQNTGTDTAFNVRLVDTLDIDLDWTTFEPIDASHTYRVSLNNETGELIFLFENILLPDSTTNEVASHGFAKFKIEHKEGLAENIEIHNTAFIYFDFNDPIQTNTTLNTLSSFSTSILEPELRLNVKVMPNPFRRSTTIQIEPLNGIQLAELNLFDIYGRLIHTYPLRDQTSVLINKRDLPAGVYFYKILDIQNRVLTTGKMIKVE